MNLKTGLSFPSTSRSVFRIPLHIDWKTLTPFSRSLLKMKKNPLNAPITVFTNSKTGFPISCNSSEKLSFSVDSIPLNVCDCLSIAPAYFSDQIASSVLWYIAVLPFSTSFTTCPWAVMYEKSTLSPSTVARIPNSFSRSNSPTCASRNACVTWSSDFPVAAAVFPSTSM